MYTTRFNNHRSAQCFIQHMNNGDVVLVSYTTAVAEVHNGWLTINGLYSATTRKHIGWFMRSLGYTYQLAKSLYEQRLSINLYTGEVKQREGLQLFSLYTAKNAITRCTPNFTL